MPSERRRLFSARRVGKVAAVTLIVALCSAAALTQTSWFRNRVRTVVEDAANGALTARLHIGRIEGTLIGSVELHDVSLVDGNDTVAAVRRIALTYDAVALLSKTIAVRAITIDGLRAHVEEENGAWSVARLAKRDTTSVSGPFDWAIRVRRLSVRDLQLRLRIRSAADHVPTFVRIDTLDARGSLVDGHLRVDADRCALMAQHPSLGPISLRLRAGMFDSCLYVSDLAIATPSSRIQGRGTLTFAPVLALRAALRAPRADLRELRAYLPSPVFDTAVTLDARMSIDDGTLRGEATVRPVGVSATQIHARGTVVMDGRTGGNTAWISVRRVSSRAFGLRDGPDAELDGTIRVRADRLSPAARDVSVDARLGPLRVAGRRLDEAALHADLRGDDLQVYAATRIAGGRLELEGVVRDVREAQEYDASVRMNDIDAAAWIPWSGHVLRVDGMGRASGRGLDPARTQGAVTAVVSGIDFDGRTIDTVACSATVEGGHIRLEHLRARIGDGELAAEGGVAITGEGRLNWRLHLPALDVLPLTDTLRGALDAEGTAELRGDTFRTDWRVRAHRLSWGDMAGDTLASEGSLALNRGAITAAGSARARGLRVASLSLDSLGADMHTDGTSMHVALTAAGDPVGARVVARMRTDSMLAVEFDTLLLRCFNQQWEQQTRPWRVSWDGTTLSMDTARFTHGQAVIEVGGDVRKEGGSSLYLAAERVEMRDFGPLLGRTDIEGLLSLQCLATGSLRAPKVDGAIRIDTLRLPPFDPVTVDIAMRSQDEVSHLDLKVRRDDLSIIQGHVQVPRDTDGWDVDGPLKGLLTIDSVDLARVPFLMVRGTQTGGRFSCALSVEGSLRRPVLGGDLRVDSGLFTMKQYGIAYRGITLHMRATSDSLLLDSLRMRGGAGVLRIDAAVGMHLSDTAIRLDGGQARVQADRFRLSESRALETDLDGWADLRLQNGDLNYTADFTIPNAQLWIPAVQRLLGMGKNENEQMPALVAARAAAAPTSPSTPTSVLRGDTLVVARRMSGVLTLRLPRDFWIRSPELNAEVHGQLELRTDGGVTRPRGTLRVHRGTVNLFGKRFEVYKGAITFLDEKDFNGTVDIELVYEFRDPNKVENTLRLLVRGPAFSPQVSFTLNEAPIGEQDAVAYIVFGRSVSEISTTDKMSVGATDIATNMLAARITSQLSTAVKLDVIELHSENNLSSGTLMVGKYILPRVFASYIFGFGQGDNSETTTETVTLEYEFTRKFSIRITQSTGDDSGLDLLFRFD